MNSPKDTLPRPGKAILRFFLNGEDYYQIIGDFEESYRSRIETEGMTKASLRFWFLLVKSRPGFISDSIYWRGVMFKNYVKVTFRNIKRHKAYSFINITGLALAIAWPLAYFVISRWLENFAYQTSIGVNAFVLAGGLATAIAFFTVIFQTLKAATANPAVSLRYE